MGVAKGVVATVKNLSRKTFEFGSAENEQEIDSREDKDLKSTNSTSNNGSANNSLNNENNL